jgi:hypothetical protein
MDARILASALVGGNWSATLLVGVSPEERAPCVHRVRRWVRRRAGLDGMEK